MERAVGAFYNRRVAHHPLRAYLGTQKDALYGVPLQAVAAVYEPKALGGGLVKRGRDKYIISPAAYEHRQQDCQ